MQNLDLNFYKCICISPFIGSRKKYEKGVIYMKAETRGKRAMNNETQKLSLMGSGGRDTQQKEG